MSKVANQINKVCNKEFSKLSGKLHSFFRNKHFTEAYYQNHLDVLTACENPKSIGQFKYFDEMFPLRQTNQMGLEYAILENPANYYCFTTSYRMEPDINKGRHNTIFPMCEFEILKDNVNDLISFETELIKSLGYKGRFIEIDYEEACDFYKVKDIDDIQEDDMCKRYAPVVFLKRFPSRTDPFFNMKKNKDGYFDKVDVLMLGVNTLGQVRGMETIGSAVRSCDVEEMKKEFKTSVGGEYAKTLYDKFGKERVDKELEEYFSMKMIPRSGGGIGFTRLLNFMRLHNLLD
jgi:aspartyl/asparaginyl-tRNA synthetase